MKLNLELIVKLYAVIAVFEVYFFIPVGKVANIKARINLIRRSKFMSHDGIIIVERAIVVY